jgi:hypothetical protein
MGFLDGFFFFRGLERVGPTEQMGSARADQWVKKIYRPGYGPGKKSGQTHFFFTNFKKFPKFLNYLLLPTVTHQFCLLNTPERSFLPLILLFMLRNYRRAFGGNILRPQA